MRTEINRMAIRIPSKSANESFARAAVAAFAAQLDPTMEEINDIKTAVSEGVTNSIIHAYPDCIGEVTVTARILEGGFFEIRIRDCGCGIPDVEKAKEPMYTTGGAERSGMGFTIMESFMDGMRVHSREGRGTTVTLRKRIKPRDGRRANP